MPSFNGSPGLALNDAEMFERKSLKFSPSLILRLSQTAILFRRGSSQVLRESCPGNIFRSLELNGLSLRNSPFGRSKSSGRLIKLKQSIKCIFSRKIRNYRI